MHIGSGESTVHCSKSSPERLLFIPVKVVLMAVSSIPLLSADRFLISGTFQRVS